jgi:serine/threonine protein kinase
VPPERAVYLLRQVCHSLSEAHASGLVHRDIKPANIFLCHYGEEYDFVKVLDFGIVRAARDETETGPGETGEGRIEGTPAFMAPEQVLGGPVDGRADIYATGCLAYWLLTGELVFTAENAVALLMQHAHTPPAPPSARTAQPVPRELDDLVLSCLAKDPAGRPQSARELSDRLGALSGVREWTQDRARDWWASAAGVRSPAGVA